MEARVVPFIEDMPAAYEWADVVLCRAGASTIAELAAVGIASILVPYPYAVDDHQTANARYLSASGAAVLMQQNELSAASLAALLRQLCADRGRLLKMAVLAHQQARTDATEQVARACVDVAQQGAA